MHSRVWVGLPTIFLTYQDTVNTVGAGFRYLIDEHYGISIGLDVAHGPEQNAIYIQAGSTW